MWCVYFINVDLDVAPVYPDCTSFVLAQRTEVYDDLLRALQVMKVVNESTPVSNVFYAMWLLENRQLSLSPNINVRENDGIHCDQKFIE